MERVSEADVTMLLHVSNSTFVELRTATVQFDGEQAILNSVGVSQL